MLFQQQYPPQVRANMAKLLTSLLVPSFSNWYSCNFGMFQDKLAPLQQVNSPKRRDTCCPDILFDKISSESCGILSISVNFVGFHEFIGI